MVYMPRNLGRVQKKDIAKVLRREGIPAAFARMDEECGFNDHEKKYMTNDDYFQYMGEREAFITGMLVMQDLIEEDISK